MRTHSERSGRRPIHHQFAGEPANHPRNECPGYREPPARGAAQRDEILSTPTGKFRMVRRTRINPTKLRYHSRLNTWYSRYLLSFVASSVNHSPERRPGARCMRGKKYEKPRVDKAARDWHAAPTSHFRAFEVLVINSNHLRYNRAHIPEALRPCTRQALSSRCGDCARGRRTTHGGIDRMYGGPEESRTVREGSRSGSGGDSKRVRREGRETKGGMRGKETGGREERGRATQASIYISGDSPHKNSVFQSFWLGLGSGGCG